eukprot:867946_1
MILFNGFCMMALYDPQLTLVIHSFTKTTILFLKMSSITNLAQCNDVVDHEFTGWIDGDYPVTIITFSNGSNPCTMHRFVTIMFSNLKHDINRIDNKKCYDDGKEGIGIELKCGTKEKLSLYSERFTTLKRNGYKVLPLVLSSVGGMNKELRQLLYTTAQYKGRRTGRGSEVI